MPINLNRQLLHYPRPRPSDSERQTDSRGKVFISIVGEWRGLQLFQKSLSVQASMAGQDQL